MYWGKKKYYWKSDCDVWQRRNQVWIYWFGILVEKCWLYIRHKQCSIGVRISVNDVIHIHWENFHYVWQTAEYWIVFDSIAVVCVRAHTPYNFSSYMNVEKYGTVHGMRVKIYGEWCKCLCIFLLCIDFTSSLCA